MTDINYNKFGLKDLHASREQIDKVKYPGQHRQIVDAISLKEKEREEERRRWRDPLFLRKFLGWFQITIGMCGVFFELFSLTFQYFFGYPIGLEYFSSLYPLVYVFSGYLILKKTGWSLWLAIGLHASAVLSFSIYDSFTFDLNPIMSWGFSLVLPQFSVSIDPFAILFLCFAFRLLNLESQRTKAT